MLKLSSIPPVTQRYNYRVTKSLPGRSYRVGNTGDIPNVLRSILATMVDR